MPTLWESLKEHNNGMCLFSIPIGSMYGKFTYLWLIYGKCRYIYHAWILWERKYIVNRNIFIAMWVDQSVANASLYGIFFWQQKPRPAVLLVVWYCWITPGSVCFCMFLLTCIPMPRFTYKLNKKTRETRKSLHPRNLTLPLKISLPKKNLGFQPSIFGGYVKSWGCNLSSWLIIPKNHKGPSQKKEG